jgi:hypothetical protein
LVTTSCMAATFAPGVAERARRRKLGERRESARAART